MYTCGASVTRAASPAGAGRTSGRGFDPARTATDAEGGQEFADFPASTELADDLGFLPEADQGLETFLTRGALKFIYGHNGRIVPSREDFVQERVVASHFSSIHRLMQPESPYIDIGQMAWYI